MNKTAGLVVFCAFLLLALSSPLRAERVTASVLLTPGAEVMPAVPPPAGAIGSAVVTLDLTRNASGAITAATMNFRGTFSFPSSVSVVGFHIHEGAVNVNGPIRFDTTVNTGSAIFFSGGIGFIDLNILSVDLAAVGRILANPTGWYVNLHTTVNPAGAIRGQITRWVETLANTVALTTAQEIMPPVPLPPNTSGVGTFTANPVRNPATGEITGGTMRFTVNADLPATSTVTGLHIHEAPAGTNGGIVLDSSVSATNSIPAPTGKVAISIERPVNTPAALGALRRLIDNPTGFYMNLHTAVNSSGVIRGQLVSVNAPPIIRQSNTSFLATGSTDAPINLWVSGIDFPNGIVVNGQEVPALVNSGSALFEVVIPASLRANPGLLHVQARNSAGLLSDPFIIVVAAQSSVNTVALTTVDAARFGNLAAPDSIVAGFGSRLSTQTAGATAIPLPTRLGGTSIYVNGVAAGLFFVSGGQANYHMPGGTMLGPAQVVVLAEDGTVSRGVVDIANTIPAIFTRRADGTGAPAAVASADGQNFNIIVSNPDGTPAPLDAGNFVALFGTGMRYTSTPVTMTLGGTAVTPMFSGAQPTLAGLDQTNFQIPTSLAGRGEVDLILSLDGKSTNTVRLRIR